MKLQGHHEHILRFVRRRQRPATRDQIERDLTDSKHAYGSGVFSLADVRDNLDAWLSQLCLAKLLNEPTEGFFEVTAAGDDEVAS